MEYIVAQILPMAKPATYTGIRKFALEAYEQSRKEANAAGNDSDAKTVDRLALQRKLGTMDDLDIASECADHFLAGIDTTSDTLMYLIWALSRKENCVFQNKLRNEVLDLSPDSLNEHGLPNAEASDKCQYLNAIIKETLRLYAPLPASEPRSLDTESDIDGYKIPAHVTVSMSPYSLHRNPEVFEQPLRFNPDRWLGPKAAEMNRWFWAFSSGGRMCIGLHLAMAEMTTLVAAIYRTYTTSVSPEFNDFSPGITSRFELFFDDQFTKVMHIRDTNKMVEIRQYHLFPTDLVPNSPRPLLQYKNVLPKDPKTSHCSALQVWDRFTTNGWDVQWIFRYGQTQLSHFHSKAHECMAVLSGNATIRFGVADTDEDLDKNTYESSWEKGGVELQAEAGDVFIIPAGVAHKTYNTRPEAPFGLLSPGKGHGIEADNPREALGKVELSGYTMMGAYSGGEWDFVLGGGDFEKVWGVPKPKLDPVFGDSENGLRRTWKGVGGAQNDIEVKL
ncbi:Cytochrome P450 monooxygenase aflV [Colletotrichum sp. SAR 10_65]|nr:Cytochrome P450 monooxygenase aflV [Colletotrichum sp. SAR 10_65]